MSANDESVGVSPSTGGGRLVSFLIRVGRSVSTLAPPGATLIRLRPNSWNDYGYGTTFDMDLRQDDDWRSVGIVKIGSRGLRPSDELPGDVHTSYVELPPSFSRLGDEYFSLGQGAGYYEDLVKTLGPTAARQLLLALRDVAITPGLFGSVSDEDVLETSLMRSASARSFDKYRAVVGGDTSKHSFALTYRLRPGQPDSPQMTFRVDRGRRMPSNVHVLIGSNGTGKTTALSNIRWAFENNDSLIPTANPVELSDREQIAGLLSISFSAFDTFPPQQRTRRDQLDFRITNVRLPWLGLPQTTSSGIEVAPPEVKRARDIEMATYVQNETLGCLAERGDQLLVALQLLADADPVLDRHRIATETGLTALDFSSLSSGHKIAMLTIASLVRYVDEKTLVLLDEPESHLHPPLLGAVTRALSNLMTTTNGLAIVATHSPVVLQEIPRRCAWIIWNLGGGPRIEQPTIETFGANLGVLTREVFDLELPRSGYHALLEEVARESSSYDEAAAKLDGEIGDEAKMLLRSMIRRREAAGG